MKSRNLRYLTREGIRNIGTNRLMSLASIAVLMSCLVMIGSAVLLFFNVDALLQNIESQNVIMVFVEKECDEQAVDAVKEQLSEVPNVTDIEFVSRNQAYEEVLESLGENASILNGIDSSFLPDGFKVTVGDMNYFKETVSQIKTIDNVLNVQENSDLAERLTEIRSAVSYVAIGIVVLLLIVALFIIANTVKITMFSRKLEISIMKAVGATNWFIRWPFLIEGIFIGIIAALLSVLVLFGIYTLASEALLTIFGILGGGLVNFWDYALYIAVAFLVISVVTGGLGSTLSIGKYLKEQGSVVVNEN